jgi:hypothetical protein
LTIRSDREADVMEINREAGIRSRTLEMGPGLVHFTEAA